MTLKNKYIYFILLLFAPVIIWAQSTELSSEINEKDLQSIISFLAADSLQGRMPGTKGDILAATYIEQKMLQFGLQSINKSMVQQFEYKQAADYGSNNQLIINKKKYKINEDYKPLLSSKSGTFRRKVVFAGYGIQINTDTLKWDDYKNMQIKGKWVIILRGLPEVLKNRNISKRFESDFYKVSVAEQKGAAGVILVSGKEYSESDVLIQSKSLINKSNCAIIHVRRQVVDDILHRCNKSIDSIENSINQKSNSEPFRLKGKIVAIIDLTYTITKTQNIIGFLPGADKKSENKYIVVGAHYDHLGLGGENSLSRKKDTVAVHNGADDNASGVASMLELAAKICSEKDKIDKNILFIAFGAEEPGFIGSNYFVNHCPVRITSISSMINLDMVGKYRDKIGLEIRGLGTARESETIIDSLSNYYNFKIKKSFRGYGSSDYSSFYSKNIPVFAFHTGLHENYHTPEDDIEQINYKVLKQITNMVHDLLLTISNSHESLTFEKFDNPYSKINELSKSFLGIIPSLPKGELSGVMIDSVITGKPADISGIKSKDKIIGINQNKIYSIEDYIYRLMYLNENDCISFKILRENQIIYYDIDLFESNGH